MSAQLAGDITYQGWKEEVGPAGTYPRLARASVTNSFSGGIEAAATNCEYTVVYVDEANGTFTGLELVTGTLDGRAGTFVLAERGSFSEDGTVHGQIEVVAGTGTGELTGLTGTGSFVYRNGQTAFPYSLDYELG
ncbi:DUF3224 domain-containing protein [Nocardiopsis valliformis]|uniref:DUF3224 domain-containing protein n=1 Tax=Nocardiopsis valliformis TaxID=239974 RepID=UPI00034916CD|nr:DUF3224 domain-containing protein [Nocardiopsis valliformis]